MYAGKNEGKQKEKNGRKFLSPFRAWKKSGKNRKRKDKKKVFTAPWKGMKT